LLFASTGGTPARAFATPGTTNTFRWVIRSYSAKRPSIITDQDSVWVTYTIFDDDDAGETSDDAYEGWARRGYPIPDGVASGERADWFGSVFVDADFVVAAGGTLSVAPGTKIFARADTDRENQGKEPTLTEIVIRGTLLAQATGQDPILFTSYDDDGQGADEWGGFLFLLQGTYESSYGFYAMLEPPSSLANVSIENAKYGVRIAGRLAPGIEDVTFTNISSGADIYLDGIDVVIPRLRYEDDGNPTTWDYSPALVRWDLTGPTTVVATNTVTTGTGDAEIGTSDKLDLIVQGDLDTQAGSGGEPVTFRPETPHPADGDDWAGLFIDGSALGCTLERADIGYGHTGVFAVSPDDLTVRDSCIDHCNDIAVHIWYSGVGGVTLEGNTIERGSAMDAEKGNECLVLENVDECTIADNLIDLGSITAVTGVARNGLRIQNSKFFCQNTNPPGPRLQSITGNWIVGPGASSLADATGILADWACGTGQRDVEFTGNYVDGWSANGIWVREALDVDVSCNAIVGNEVGVKFDRDKHNSAWPPVRFRGNRIAPHPTDGDVGTRTTNALAIDYGPNGTGTTGDNSLLQWTTRAFLVENDPNTANVMDARNNAWFVNGTLNDTTSVISTYITSEITDPPDVNIASPKDDEEGACYPTNAPTVGCSESQSRGAGTGPIADPRFDIAAPRAADALGEVLESNLGAPHPNPGRRGATLELMVTNPGERFQVEVFDVRGRRVARLIDGHVDGGRHRLVWSGRDDLGRPAAAGVYFVRATSPSYTRTRKIVLVD
jgi:hypothetical protein